MATSWKKAQAHFDAFDKLESESDWDDEDPGKDVWSFTQEPHLVRNWRYLDSLSDDDIEAVDY